MAGTGSSWHRPDASEAFEASEASEAMVVLQLEEMAYEAALAAVDRVVQQSLVEFLR